MYHVSTFQKLVTPHFLLAFLDMAEQQQQQQVVIDLSGLHGNGEAPNITEISHVMQVMYK